MGCMQEMRKKALQNADKAVSIATEMKEEELKAGEKIYLFITMSVYNL